MPAAAPQKAPRISPWAGAPGSEVTVRMNGLRAGVTFWIGTGALGAEQEILEEVDTDGDGSLEATVSVPSWAREDDELFFFVADTDSQPLAISPPFHVTADDGTFRLEGRITDVDDCAVLRAENDELYRLEGNAAAVEPGDRLVVVGRVAEDPDCAGGRSVTVDRVEPR